MEVRDGFIVGVFNYCDAWCERCALTSHCRLFADKARLEAALDPNLKAVVDAPLLPEEVPPPPPMWLQQLLEEAQEACSDPKAREELERMRARVAPAHRPIVARAMAYAARAHQWLTESSREPAGGDDDALEVIVWFHFFIPAKVRRALTIWPDEDPDDETCSADSDGSAKTALLGIDRSRSAWLELIERGAVTPAEGARFIADLGWLGRALEQGRPKARAFVRPGLDEPEALAQFLAGEKGWNPGHL
jgi:hypothetical protein